MNAKTQAEGSALAVQPDHSLDLAAPIDASSLILGPSWDRIQAFGKMMARGSATVPNHLKGNEADCIAVAMQALGWRMNPFAVAQKTHVSQSGQLGYEAQLINAVIQASGALETDPDYEYIGDWNKVLGKVEERKSEKGGKYYVATYTKADEVGLGVIVKARLRGEQSERRLQVLMSQAYPRFSTQWATDPMQQISYLALRKFVRLHKPGVILGVYTNDEIETTTTERFMGPADVVTAPAPTKAAYSAEQLASNTADWRARIFKPDPEKGEPPLEVRVQRAEHLIKTISTKYSLSDEQRAAIHALVKVPPVPAPATSGSPAKAGDPVQDVEPKSKAADASAPKVTYAQVADRLNRAKSPEQLDEAATLIDAVAAKDQREELNVMYENRKGELQ